MYVVYENIPFGSFPFGLTELYIVVTNWIITYLAPQNEAIIEARPEPEPTSSTDLSRK